MAANFDALRASMRRARGHSDDEHRLQCACVRWFAYQHPELRGRLFAVPNGGRRDAVTGAKMKAEGVVAGVADLVLLVRRAGYGALLVEMKTATGRQSEAQREWERIVTANDDYKYVICRSIEEFITLIESYLS